MTETTDFTPGNYRYVRGPFQYSGGAAALPGYAIERVRFRTPVPIEAGFAAIEAHLNSMGRPLTSFCACELRSPAPFTPEGFIAFNRIYVGTLERWGIFKDDDNPVARSNVCPEIDPPAEPCFEAFCYTVPIADGAPEQKSFVISGAGEARGGEGSYEERTVRYGETTPDAMREKARHVLAAMESRLEALGASWSDVSATQAYTVHDIHSFLADEIVQRGAIPAGLTWYYARPPVDVLDFEMDVRAVSVERVL